MIPIQIFGFILVFFSQIINSECSLTLVVDTTVSMKEEIEVIKNNIGTVLNAINKSEFKIEKFILVPFNDDVQPLEISTIPDDFKQKLNRLSVSGGHDCPENSLAGIQRALEVTAASSKIFVFTDAYANDHSKVDAIKDLCKRTNNQVVIFLSGSCVPVGSKDTGSIEVYREITSACSGMLFHFDSVNLRQAFKYMQEILTDSWTDVSTEGTFTGYKQITFPVTASTKGLMIAVSGDYPTVEVTDPEGSRAGSVRVVNARHTLVLKILNLKSGEYRINVHGRNTASLTIYSKKDFPFLIGFSPKVPRNLMETSRKPIPGNTNYILITISENNDLKLHSIELSDSRERNNFTLNLHYTNDGLKTYITKCMFYPNISFRMTVFGVNEIESKEFTETSGVLEPQNNVIQPQWTAPQVEMLDQDKVVEYGTNITLSCKVVGYPRPQIWWSDGKVLDNFETFLLQIPDVHISYFTLNNVTTNGTYYCEAKNANGEDHQRIHIYVHRNFVFDVIQKPEDKIIEYNEEDKIFCEVNAYPEATITWYHNDTNIDYADNTEVLAEEHALVIKNMGLKDVGTYTCELKNSVETKRFSAEVTISGIESPLIDKTETASEINLKPGVTTELECRVTEGKPSPQITWKFQSDGTSYFNEVPYDIYAHDGRLRFSDVKPEHKGIYRCIASNFVGRDYRDFTANVQYPPFIDDNNDELLSVIEGSPVELPCRVKSNPAASVKWQFTQNGVMVLLDNRFITDDDYTLRFRALWKDSGDYHCMAENEVGRREKIIKVNVLVPPYIEAPKDNPLSVKAGDTVTLPCVLQYGNPAPTTVWEFTARNGSNTILRNTPSHSLYLSNLTSDQEGTYTCFANNPVGIDRIKIHLKVV